jgi:PPM family protein phosphatase
MIENQPVYVSVVAFTHQGKVREENEDTIAVGQWNRNRPMLQPEVTLHPVNSPWVGVIADGMGGHAAGEVASRFVVEKITDAAINFDSEESIIEQLKSANRELFDLMAQKPSTEGMGTTIAGLAVTPESLFIFNVGDSRVYKEQNRFLKQLSMDDSGGRITAYGDGSSSQETKTGLLSQAFGGAKHFIEIDPHILKEKLSHNQRYLICSDGLSDLVNIDTMEACFVDSDLDSATHLFQKAIKAGGRDNISMLIIRTHLRKSVESED